MPESEISFRFREGVHLEGSLLWFDALAERSLSFVSHAMVGAPLKHRKIIATQQTVDLLRATRKWPSKARSRQQTALVTPYERTFSLGELELTLSPSGFQLGSSALSIRWKGKTLLYARYLGTNEMPWSQPAQARPCDILMLSGTTPAPCLSSRVDQLHALESALRRMLTAHNMAIVFCEPTATAQHLAISLQSSGFSIVVHPWIAAAAKVYARYHPSFPTDIFREQFRAKRSYPGKHILLWPDVLASSRAAQQLRQAMRSIHVVASEYGDTACKAPTDSTNDNHVFTIPLCRSRASVDEFVSLCGARRVIFVGNFQRRLVAKLQRQGISVACLAPEEQLELF